VQAVYQVHHGTLIPSGALAYQLVRGLNPRGVGVELDPGNQTFEGTENWDDAARWLGEYLVAMGIKDSAPRQDANRMHEPGKGWRRDWVPLDEGVINWHGVISALQRANFRGPLVLMPFYDENDPVSHVAKLKREVAYLRSVIQAVEAQAAK